MNLDLSAAVEAAARAWRDENARQFPAFATEWDDLPAATRRNDLAVMTEAIAAAAPLIEAQVRAQVAADIDLPAVMDHLLHGCRDCLLLAGAINDVVGASRVRRATRGESS